MGRKHTEETKLRFREVGTARAKKAWETRRLNGTTFPWNKGVLVPQISNEKNPGWKGEKVSYFGLHAWVKRKLGAPGRCSNPNCVYPRKNSRGRLMLKPKAFHWANKSKVYKRDLSDWIRLCANCHSKFDNNKLFL